MEGDWPYLWLDATYVKVRQAGRIVSVAVIVAVAVNDQGRREVLGMTIGASEAETFWTEFLRALTRRGLRGVKLVISDAHEGLKAAAARVLNATWQRCRVHFMRNLLAHAGKSGRRVVAAFVATAFAQEDAQTAKTQWRQVADQLRPKAPKLANLMDQAEPDVLAYMTFPKEHRTKLHSTNPIERLNGEIKRRTNVVGIFPNEAAITRLFERLRDEYGFTGKITIVKDYICGVRQRRREMFVPLTHPPGHAQVDFGEALAVIGGVERKIHFLAMSLPHSDACFVKAYPGETTEAFCDGHVSGFSFFGGVPRSILYDNTRIAVARILGDGKRQRTRVFSELRSHYLFEDRFGRPGNLSTHSPASLYNALPAPEARRILRRLEFHFTPKHASWLNMVEIEIGVLRGQCLDRRISSRDILEAEIAAWERQRNDSAARIKWMFTTEKARHKLSRAYPKPHLPIEDQPKES